MKNITYAPAGINNFHNSDDIKLRVTGKTVDGMYIISAGQAKKIERHFCGVSGCRCPAGAAIQLREDKTEFGIRIKWCGEADNA